MLEKPQEILPASVTETRSWNIIQFFIMRDVPRGGDGRACRG
jgi:hypothetical protein